MEKLPKKFLIGLPISAKVLVTCFVLAIAGGYSISLLQIRNRSSFSVEKTVRHFRGEENEGIELSLPQSNTAMISVAHVHTFSQPLVLGLMGFLFLGTLVGERSKALWILFSFLSSAGMNLSPWLIRDVSPQFAYLLHASGALMILSFFWMAFNILRDVWKPSSVHDLP